MLRQNGITYYQWIVRRDSQKDTMNETSFYLKVLPKILIQRTLDSVLSFSLIYAFEITMPEQ